MRTFVVVAICLVAQVIAQNKRPQGFTNNNNNYNDNNNNNNNNNYNQNNNNNYNDNNSQNYQDQGSNQYQSTKKNQYDNQQNGKFDYTTPIPIIRFDKEQTVDGSYKTSYETGNNIIAEETGFLKNVGVDTQEALVQHGSFTYTSPEGQIITVQYTADEQGFRATGDHLPTAPPVPAEIQKSIDLIYSQIQESEEERKRNPNFREDDGSYRAEYNSENFDDNKKNNFVNPTTTNNYNQNQNNRNNFDQYNNNENNNNNNNFNNNNTPAYNQNYDQNQNQNQNNNNNNNFPTGSQKNFNHPKRRPQYQ